MSRSELFSIFAALAIGVASATGTVAQDVPTPGPIPSVITRDTGGVISDSTAESLVPSSGELMSSEMAFADECGCTDSCKASACDCQCGWLKTCAHAACSMHPHYNYFPPMHGYYYFRPYHHSHLVEQQALAGQWGEDPRNPYANEVLKRVREQYVAERSSAADSE